LDAFGAPLQLAVCGIRQSDGDGLPGHVVLSNVFA
jgi:hypothetical protein